MSGSSNDLEFAEELGAKGEDDELVTSDYPGFVQLLECYEGDAYLSAGD